MQICQHTRGVRVYAARPAASHHHLTNTCITRAPTRATVINDNVVPSRARAAQLLSDGGNDEEITERAILYRVFLRGSDNAWANIMACI